VAAPMRKLRRILTGLMLLLLLSGGAALLAFWQGLIPARYSPLPLLRLDHPSTLFLDWQLAELRHEPDLCRRVLTAPHIDADVVPDNPLRNGCGWVNSVRLAAAGGARISVDKLSCEAAAAFALWMKHDVQPLARSLLGERVASVRHMGAYACRNIIGSPFWRHIRSEHATANAIDIAGFTLADGRWINVGNHWSGAGRYSAFLRAVHQRACRYFRVALGPDFNNLHKNHFHLDRGTFSACQ
jgi:hypothetical protein